jgi:hypothetical protein
MICLMTEHGLSVGLHGRISFPSKVFEVTSITAADVASPNHPSSSMTGVRLELLSFPPGNRAVPSSVTAAIPSFLSSSIEDFRPEVHLSR